MSSSPQGALVVYLAGAHLTEDQVLNIMAEFCVRLRAIVDENGAIVVLPHIDPRLAYETLRLVSAKNEGLRMALHLLHMMPTSVMLDTQLKAMGTMRVAGGSEEIARPSSRRRTSTGSLPNLANTAFASVSTPLAAEGEYTSTVLL
jgi:hypothetical protein